MLLAGSEKDNGSVDERFAKIPDVAVLSALKVQAMSN